MDVLLKWNEKPVNEKTYNNLKDHMIKRYHALYQVGTLTIQDLLINHIHI